PASNRKWEIPGHDASDDPHGLPQSEIETTSSYRNCLAAKFCDCSGVKFENAGAEGGLIKRVTDRFSDVKRFQFRNSLDVLPQQTRDVEQNLASLPRRHVAPSTFPGSLSRPHRLVHILDVGRSDLGKGVFVCGID